MLGRRIVSDADGSYCDMTGKVPVVRQIPADKNGLPAFTMHNFDGWWGSHWSLDILWPLLCPERYSDFCNTSVQMAKGMGKENIYQRFIKGAANYRHVIWPEKQSAWVRMKGGNWMPNFLPRKKSFEQNGFCSSTVTKSYD